MATKSFKNLLIILLISFSANTSCKKDEPENTSGDRTAPTVVSTIPLNGSTSVSIRTTISAYFSELMDNQSILPQSFTVNNGVSGTLSYGDSLVILTPDSPLDSSIVYTATITTTIKDKAGNPLQNQYSWSFVTISSSENQKPTASTFPVLDVSFGDDVYLDGSDSSDPEGEPLTYRWVQVMGPDVTGGIGELSGATPSFTVPSSISTLQFDLFVNDGVKDSDPYRVQINVYEFLSSSVFVTTTGNDGYPGTKAQPKKSLLSALQRAKEMIGATVYMTEGSYSLNGTLELENGISIYGGFDEQDWTYSETNYSELISNSNTAITASYINNETLISGISIIGPRVYTPGGSSYGVIINDCTELRFRNCRINSGRAGDGVNGTQVSYRAEEGGNGSLGQPGCEDSDFVCSQCERPLGGAGGISPVGMHGGAGGLPGHESSIGSPGIIGAGGTSAGSGAPAGLGDWNPSSAYCGADGLNGTSGANGISGNENYTTNGYTPTFGYGGTTGSHGRGGGGGGGGGGGSTSCDSYGGAGGGGGGGGAGGIGGRAGTSAGGSFAIYIWNSNIIIERCTLIVEGGGIGGFGTAGQLGGYGGLGARVGSTYKGNNYGGTNEQDDGSNGGCGGDGGAGGNGGAGGGGAGGASIGILAGGLSNLTAISVVYDIAPGGQGGTSPGNEGNAGRQSNIHEL